MENFEFLYVTGLFLYVKISCWQINRVKTCVWLRFWTLGGKLGLTPRQRIGKALWVLPRSGGMLCWKIFEILHLQRFVFLHSEVSDNLFQLPKKKITFLDNLFNHDLIPALRWKIDGLLIKRFSNYNLMMNIQVGDQSDYFWWSTMTS